MDHHSRSLSFATLGLVPGPGDGVGPWELAGQRRVEIHHSTGEAGEKGHREDAHPPGEDDEVGASGLDDVAKSVVVVLAGLAVVAWQRGGWDSGAGGAFEGVGIGAIRHHVDHGSTDDPIDACLDD